MTGGDRGPRVATGSASRLIPGPGERGLPLLSALLLTLSYPPLHLLVPPFVALVPFATFVYRLPEGRGGRAAAARGGFLLGVTHFGLLLHWIPVGLARVTALAVPAFGACVLMLAGLTALFAWAFHRGVHEVRAPLWMVLPVTWTAAEWVRGHAGDLALPWLGLGTSLTGYPELVGIAELVGARGVTFWVALVSGLTASLIVGAGTAGQRWFRVVVLAVVVLAPTAWGTWRASTLEVRPVALVTVVQPSVPQDVKLDAARAIPRTVAILDSLMASAPRGADLVVWPEATFPAEFLENPSLVDFVAAWSRESGAPILLGAQRRQGSLNGRTEFHNSAFLVGSNGPQPYVYDKRFLVPGVERAPFLRWGWGSGQPGGLASGDVWATGGVGDVRLGTVICFESAFPAASRALRRAGADFLVNLTNDAWFGGPSRYARTGALWQHPAHLIMRAIETRTGVVRAANTGISLFVDPLGRTRAATALYEPAVIADTVLTTSVPTLYVRVGDVMGPASVLGALLFLVPGWRRRGPRTARSRRTDTGAR